MAKREMGAERLGQDDDEGNAGLRTEKVQIENAYFEKLRARLGQQLGSDQATADPITPDDGNTLAALERLEEAEKPAGPVIYNDDGSVYKRPG